MSKDLSDFQTPHSLVDKVLKCLFYKEKKWTRVLEPTCGQGNFIKGLLKLDNPPQEIQGIEIQDKHILNALEFLKTQKTTTITIKQANIFEFNLQENLTWNNDGNLLIIGNPPWVTNSALSALESENLPPKTNFKGFSGFGALAGESNFDIAEYIWLKLIKEFIEENPTIALLCKTSVARNVLKFAHDTEIPIGEASIWKIDSRQSFGAAVDACLFRIDIDTKKTCYEAKVYEDLNALDPYTTIGVVNKRLTSNISANSALTFIDGTSPCTWRQGLKHDAAAIFELEYNKTGSLTNKLGEIVQVEHDYIYPLLKSSDLGGKEKQRPRRAVLVTQKYIGQDTSQLEHLAPLLWKYLVSHKSFCENRKSAIYQSQPPFAIFGIGEYSFLPYKVAISGMYKTLKFSLIGPVNGRPVQFDDTCYFVACESARQAALILNLLNHPLCYQFIHSIVFWDAKRPITKKLLQRIDLKALLNHVDKISLVNQINFTLDTFNFLHEESPLDPFDENIGNLLEDYLTHSKVMKSVISTKKQLKPSQMRLL